MSNVAQPLPGQVRTVQDYIDELPMWPDGTRLHSNPMTSMQRRIWMLAAAGKFFEGFVVFMTGVALPLIAREFNITPAQNGFISAASLCGILIGAVGLGSLSDRYGRKSMFIVEMIIFTAFLGAAVFCTNFVSLVICLFGLGLALGCDYPTAHMIISENIPSTSRGKLVLGAFAFQAVGALAGTAVGYAVLVLCRISMPGAGCMRPRSFPPLSSPLGVSISPKARTGCMLAAPPIGPSSQPAGC